MIRYTLFYIFRLFKQSIIREYLVKSVSHPNSSFRFSSGEGGGGANFSPGKGWDRMQIFGKIKWKSWWNNVCRNVRNLVKKKLWYIMVHYNPPPPKKNFKMSWISDRTEIDFRISVSFFRMLLRTKSLQWVHFGTEGAKNFFAREGGCGCKFSLEEGEGEDENSKWKRLQRTLLVNGVR